MRSNRRDFLKGSLALAAASLPVVAFAQDPTQQEPIVYLCPMHPDVQAKVAGKCPKCNMKLVASKAASAGTEDFYVCPMHPDVMSNAAGNCPKCNMKLVKAAPPETNDYNVKIETVPKSPKAGEKVKLRFTIFHPTTDKQVKEFNILHDMPFHLFVVSQDLEHFDHIHPDKQIDGSFTIETVLPKGGYYKIFCDFFPAGGMPQVTQHNLVTSGFNGDLISSQAKLVPDKTLVKTIAGTRFELKFEPAQPFSGKPAELHYHLADEKSGEPVNDLQPYLGAWGHTLILSEDASDYLHSHPIEMIPEDVDRSGLKGGPQVVFDTFFPHPGNYRIWSQFQRQGKIITVSYTVAVPRMR
ncbi:MAG: twin-arginine translocation signal domain-containing protein [Acidobacteria bacterium]|nr:twin-arginine translocation signal domain-containing protein [Acidobacteriota bacterium]